MPVSEVDDRRFGVGPVSQLLRSRYRGFVMKSIAANRQS